MALALQNISLLRNHFEFIDIKNDSNYNVSILDYIFTHSEDDEKNKNMASAIVTFDLMDGIKKPIFNLKCSFLAVYSADTPKDYDILKNYIVIAHLIPYLREYVSNLTSRMPGPCLMLDPINTTQLWDTYEKKMKDAETTDNR